LPDRKTFCGVGPAPVEILSPLGFRCSLEVDLNAAKLGGVSSSGSFWST
jgi:hypothetical protein